MPVLNDDAPEGEAVKPPRLHVDHREAFFLATFVATRPAGVTEVEVVLGRAYLELSKNMTNGGRL